jgi:transcription antitermination factor NusG
MKLLNEQQLYKITKFMENHARKIDYAIYDYHFNNIHSKKIAIQELKNYQNSDGGFGNGIEPDFRLPSSSPMATTIGLQYARVLGLSSEEPIVKNAISYFIHSYDHEDEKWHPVPPEVNAYPHAPWWHYNIETNQSGVESHWANPSAEVVSYLYEYADLVPASFLNKVSEIAIQKLIEEQDKLEMHDVLCYLKLVETAPETLKLKIKPILIEKTKQIVSMKEDEWANYGPKPLTFAPTPSSFLYPYLKDSITANLDYDIAQLTNEGCWEPNWAWGQYEDEWIKAREEWKGYISVNMMKTLHAYNRVEQFKM